MIPEVVSGIVLILVFAIWLNVLPLSASVPPGAGLGDTIYHLILPAIPLTLILFGYIAQMARAGTVEALNSDYARTATLKGLPRGVMIRRHILRNSLLPTITVVATQTGYLIGGLVLVEIPVPLPGHRLADLNAANSKDFPMLEAGILVIGVVYMVATLIADILYSLLNPRIRYRGRRMSIGTVPVESRGALSAGSGRPAARVPAQSHPPEGVHRRRGDHRLLDLRGDLRQPARAPRSATPRTCWRSTNRPSGSHWFGTDSLGRDMFSRVITGSRDILITAPLATLIGTVLGTALGLVMGYFRGITDDVIGRFVEAFLALPLVVTGILGVVALGPSDGTLIVVIGIIFTPLIARTVRAAVLLERELDYVSAARLRGETSPTSCSSRSCPTCLAPIMVEFTVRLGYAVFTIVTLSFLGFGIPAARRPTGAWTSHRTSRRCRPATGGRCCSTPLAIASLVIGVNLIATSVESALDAS